MKNEKRRFISSWFNDHSTWLEYSINKDVAFCLYCYLFKPDHGGHSSGDSFIGEGFRNWKNKERFDVHVGPHFSTSSNCVKVANDLMKHKKHIEVVLCNQTNQMQVGYRVRLFAMIDCIRFLLRQVLPLREDDESKESANKGNFLELLQFLVDHNEDVNRVQLANAPKKRN